MNICLKLYRDVYHLSILSSPANIPASRRPRVLVIYLYIFLSPCTTPDFHEQCDGGPTVLRARFLYSSEFGPSRRRTESNPTVSRRLSFERASLRCRHHQQQFHLKERGERTNRVENLGREARKNTTD